MTRIFEALKKAQASRPSGGLAAAPSSALPDRSRDWGPSVGEDAVGALPLLGGVELTEETLRETTALRVGLESAIPDRVPRSVMFASAQAGEGTSTVALQFAQSVAHGGSRVLFVDAHARRPVCYADESQRFAVLDPRVGAESMAGVMVPNFMAVPATEEAVRVGQVPPSVIRSAMHAAIGTYDWVIVDGPPVVESPDAAMLAAHVDGVVLVLHAGRAKRPVVSRAVELLRKSGGRVLGTVLNHRIHEIPGFIYRRI